MLNEPKLTIVFKLDGAIEVKFSSVKGITPVRLETGLRLAENELRREYVRIRHTERVKTHEAKANQTTKGEQ